MNEETPDRDIIDKLGNADRVLKQARMLPSSPLSDEQIAGVRADYIRYTRDRGIFDATIARELGIAPSSLSQWRSDQYAGDVEKVARQVNAWMERHARRAEAELPKDYIDTKVAQDMKAVIGVACATCSMAAIVAPSGSGKTKVLEVLAEMYRGVLIYVHEDMTPKSFLVRVAQAVKVHGTSAADLLDRIVARLKGTNRPLFLDEAHRLRPEMLSRIRSIHDQAGVPIILAGAHEILTRIDDRADGRGQLASRCLVFNVVESLISADDPDGTRAGRPLFTKEEIAAFLNRLQVRFDPDGFQLVWALACLPNHGCLRTVLRCVMLLRPQQSDRGRVITRGEVVAALALMFGQQGRRLAKLADRQREAMECAA